MNNSEDKNENWAIVMYESVEKVGVMPLGGYDSWEWDSFETLKRGNEIVWFESKNDAVEFVFENFDESVIGSDLFKWKKLPREYNW